MCNIYLGNGLQKKKLGVAKNTQDGYNNTKEYKRIYGLLNVLSGLLWYVFVLVCAYMPTLFIIAMVGIFARQYEANCLVFLCVLQMFFLAMVCFLVKLEILTERFRRQLIEQY